MGKEGPREREQYFQFLTMLLTYLAYTERRGQLENRVKTFQHFIKKMQLDTTGKKIAGSVVQFK